jgi:hypothetical protein
VKSRKVAMGIAAGLTTLGLAAGTGPVAFAAINFGSATWLVGGVNYQFFAIGSFATGADKLTTPTQANNSLAFSGSIWEGGDFAAYAGFGACVGATATESTEADGDVVITCAPLQFTPTDVWYSQSFLLYNDEPVMRSVFSLENRGALAVDLDPAAQRNLVKIYDNSAQKGASSKDPLSCFSMTAEDHWAVFAGLSNTTISGVAWQAEGGTAFTTLGEDCTGGLEAYPTMDSLAAGEKVIYMTFIATGEPAGTSSGEMDTAFAEAVSEMAAFNELNDTLCRGIDDGTVIEGWGTCGAPAPNPELPDTGANTAVKGSSIAIGSGLLIAGALALVMVRRRQARS